jgi:transcriptional regulator with XRE-family HTH domain
MARATATTNLVGSLLRAWRRQRNLSQLDLALLADTSARHLSFVETGRARPSRELLVRLTKFLDVPVRQRNAILLAAGHAPVYEQSEFSAPKLGPVIDAIERLLAGHEPYPAVVFDAELNVLRANRTILSFVDDVAPELLEPPLNIMRLSLHPKGLAPKVVNLPDWRTHLLARLRRDIVLTGDQGLKALYQEVSGYRYPDSMAVDVAKADEPSDAIAVPLRLRVLGAELSLLSAVTTFGSPMDITVAGLTIETFYPADAHSAALLHKHFWPDDDPSRDERPDYAATGRLRGSSWINTARTTANTAR